MLVILFSGTSDVTFENCTVHGDWGRDHTYKPRWWKTALRLKSDRHTNGTLQNIHYRNIRGVGVDLLFDIQMWYPCQNQSGMANYQLCRQMAHPKPEPHIRPHIRNISLVNITAPPGGAWRTGWLNCLPESPCKDITIEGVVAPGALPWVCEHVEGMATGGEKNLPSANECFAK
eukprot:COSAG02_NODE_687_length_18478_cov_23.093476_5_plen_174_part_00